MTVMETFEYSGAVVRRTPLLTLDTLWYTWSPRAAGSVVNLLVKSTDANQVDDMADLIADLLPKVKSGKVILNVANSLTNIQERIQYSYNEKHGIAELNSYKYCLLKAADHSPVIVDGIATLQGVCSGESRKIMAGLASLLSGYDRNGEKIGPIADEDILPTLEVIKRCKGYGESLLTIIETVSNNKSNIPALTDLAKTWEVYQRHPSWREVHSILAYTASDDYKEDDTVSMNCAKDVCELLQKIQTEKTLEDYLQSTDEEERAIAVMHRAFFQHKLGDKITTVLNRDLGVAVLLAYIQDNEMFGEAINVLELYDELTEVRETLEVVLPKAIENTYVTSLFKVIKMWAKSPKHRSIMFDALKEADDHLEVKALGEIGHLFELYENHPNAERILNAVAKRVTHYWNEAPMLETFLTEHKDHPRLMQCIDTLENRKTLVPFDLQVSITPYGPLFDKYSGDRVMLTHFMDNCYFKLAEEVNDELTFNEIKQLMTAYYIVERSMGKHGALRDASREVFFEVLNYKLEEGTDLRSKKRILWEWSIKAAEMIRDNPSSLQLGVGI